MKRLKVKLNTAKEIALFVNVCVHYDCDITCRCGRYDIDAKSIVGMVNFIGKEIEVLINCDDERVIDLFVDEINLWIVER